MTQGIVVSRRDGVLTGPDGTKWRVHRGKTLAHAGHPAVLANPQDWSAIEITLMVDTPDVGSSDRDATLDELRASLEDARGEQAELEETLAQRDAELARLVDGLAGRGVDLPAEDARQPGWLVDLVFAWMSHPMGPSFVPDDDPPVAPPPAPKPRKRAAPPVAIRPADDRF